MIREDRKLARSCNNAIVYVNWNNIAELKLLTAS
jgi:hypothetical protein